MELSLLEEELRGEESSGIVVFLSQEPGLSYTLATIKVKLDEKVVASHVYVDREEDALRMGGLQELFRVPMEQGKHRLEAIYSVKKENQETFTHGSTLDISIGKGGTYLELILKRDAETDTPKLVYKVW